MRAQNVPRLALAPPSGASLWAVGSLLIWAMYAVVFRIAAGDGWAEAARDGLANVFPLSLLAAGASVIVKQVVMPRRVATQAMLHVALAIAFATTWYALVLVMLGFLLGLSGGSFAVRGFSGPAFVWQVFQGFILYALVVATCHAVRGGRRAADVTIVTGPPLEHYLTRDGDEMVPVRVRDIVTITGAQDYAEVLTTAGTHLVRMSLGEFERRLDPTRFIRVHRSAIVNLDQLRRAEPAGGGRMIAHMTCGDEVAVSRAGAQLLRSFVV